VTAEAMRAAEDFCPQTTSLAALLAERRQRARVGFGRGPSGSRPMLGSLRIVRGAAAQVSSRIPFLHLQRVD